MKKLLWIFLLTPLLHAQTVTYFKVGIEGQSVTVPAGTIVRYGSGTTWSLSVWYAVPTTFTATNSYFGVGSNGIVKEVDVLETSIAQAVTVAGSSVAIPAAPVAPPTTPPVSGTAAYCNSGLATSPTIGYTIKFNASGKMTTGNATMTCQ